MSELMNAHKRDGLRRQLLATVSAMALLAIVNAEKVCAAESDGDRPSLWIELGGQFDQLNAGAEAWVPPVTPPPLPPVTSLPLGHPVPGSIGSTPTIGWDTTAKAIFQPENSDWIFTAAVSYGRSTKKESSHDQNYQLPGPDPGKYASSGFFDGRSDTHESHTVIDFKVGREVGLGMFGGRGSSSLNLGLRYAQFNSTTGSYATSGPAQRKYAVINDEMHAQRRFTGVGPSISFDASDPFVGSSTEGLSFDWGANAAILFGRQKTKLNSSQLEHLVVQFGALPSTVKTISHLGQTRSRTAIVPNIGGFAGLSFHYAAAKVSFGYRADLFFGALDGGINMAKKENRGFYGPFATISFGIGG